MLFVNMATAIRAIVGPPNAASGRRPRPANAPLSPVNIFHNNHHHQVSFSTAYNNGQLSVEIQLSESRSVSTTISKNKKQNNQKKTVTS